jgi:hypothetical protein
MRDSFHHGVNALLLKNPKWRKMAFAALDVIQKKEPEIVISMTSGSELVIPFYDIYCQTVRKDKLKMEDHLMVAVAWQRILSHDWIYSCVQVREPPHSDGAKEANDDILKDMINYYNVEHPEAGFRFKKAEFWGGAGAGADGVIAFEEPFVKMPDGCLGRDLNGVWAPTKKPARQGVHTEFPLEVGYCMPDQMDYHIAASGRVARFPYEHEFIIFIEDTHPNQSLL